MKRSNGISTTRAAGHPRCKCGVPGAEKASSTLPTRGSDPILHSLPWWFSCKPFPDSPGAAGRGSWSALCSGYCTYSSWQLARACINHFSIVYSKKEVYEIYNYCFQGHNRYVGVRTGVSCYSQREKILPISPRHSVWGGRAAQVLQTFLYGQKKGGWREEYTKASFQLTVPCKKYNIKWETMEKD